MISAAGTDDERHLLIFADNRQDAAFQAGWMRDHARRYRLRYLMRRGARRARAERRWPGVGRRSPRRAPAPAARRPRPRAGRRPRGVRLGRRRGVRPRRRRAAVALPAHPDPARAGDLVHAARRPRALGPAARRLLRARRPTSRTCASSPPNSAMTPEALCDGIAALLDVWRRARMLHDADEPIFERWWTGGQRGGSARLHPVRLHRGQAGRHQARTPGRRRGQVGPHGRLDPRSHRRGRLHPQVGRGGSAGGGRAGLGALAEPRSRHAGQAGRWQRQAARRQRRARIRSTRAALD